MLDEREDDGLKMVYSSYELRIPLIIILAYEKKNVINCNMYPIKPNSWHHTFDSLYEARQMYKLMTL